jgi:hypothetical protein
VESLVRTLAQHLASWGGRPLLCVFDRPKTIALQWQKNGEVSEWNPIFACATLEMGVVGVELCWPYRAQQGSAAVCSGCHQPAPGYDHLPERCFEFIPLCRGIGSLKRNGDVMSFEIPEFSLWRCLCCAHKISKMSIFPSYACGSQREHVCSFLMDRPRDAQPFHLGKESGSFQSQFCRCAARSTDDPTNLLKCFHN